MQIVEVINRIKGFLASLMYSDSISKEQIRVLEAKFQKLINLLESIIYNEEYYSPTFTSAEDDYDEVDFIEEPEQLYNFIEKEPRELSREDFDLPLS